MNICAKTSRHPEFSNQQIYQSWPKWALYLAMVNTNAMRCESVTQTGYMIMSQPKCLTRENIFDFMVKSSK
ncbi:MAG: hypothetical protein GF311_22690 [Candidatus Lokiarchaeota archaeon]|nr:hypothetical protein [Candidatus Lokiarchaeota archaeon]